MTRSPVRRRLLLLAALALLPACFSSEPTPTEPDEPVTATVEMTNALAFDPSPVTIHVGDTVKWTNISSVTHSVTADPALAADAADVMLPEGAEPFNSGFLNPGDEYSRTFTVAGEYRYFCIPHEFAGMVGTVIVDP